MARATMPSLRRTGVRAEQAETRRRHEDADRDVRPLERRDDVLADPLPDSEHGERARVGELGCGDDGQDGRRPVAHGREVARER